MDPPVVQVGDISISASSNGDAVSADITRSSSVSTTTIENSSMSRRHHMERQFKIIKGRQQGFSLGFCVAPKDQMLSVDLGLWYWLLVWHTE